MHYDHGNGIAVADVDGDGLPDIYFTNQIGGNQLWKNLGGGRFADITKDAGVALADRISVTASFADVDNDGDEDLFVTTVRGGNVLFENDGHGRFSDVSKAAGVDYVGHSSGAVFFDFDNDGLLDLYVCNVGHYTADERGRGGAFVGLADGFDGHLHADRSETAILYKNLGGLRFRDVTKAMGLGDAGWSGDASVADLNDDGFPDLYTLNMQGSNHYFQNQGGKTFVDRTPQVFPRTPWGAMGIKFFDYDNDGRPDLLVTDMHSDMSLTVGPEREKLKSRMAWTTEYLQGDGTKFIFGNAFFHNAGASKMEEISDRVGLENYWPWGPSVGDLNADGWQDVFIASSMDYPHRYGINSLLLNNRGETFLDSEFILGIEPRRGGRTHTPWFDVDCSLPASASDPALQGTIGEDHGDGAARHPIVGHVRYRPGRRSRPGHQRLQLRAAGARQQPRPAPLRALAGRGSCRHRVKPRRARRQGPRHRRRPCADAVARRQVRLSLAERPAAVFWPWRSHHHPERRDRVAVRPDAGPHLGPHAQYDAARDRTRAAAAPVADVADERS